MRNRHLLALAAILAGSTLACGSAAEAGAGGSSSLGDPLFGGLCVPTQGLGTRALDSDCQSTYGGHAQVLGALVDVGLAKAAVDLSSTGELPATGGVKDATLLELEALSGAIVGSTASAVVIGMSDQTAAEAEVQGLHINLGVIDLDADVVKSRSEAMCGSRAGGSIITNLRINGLAVAITGAPNQHVVVGLVNVTINEQIARANGIRTNALHVSVLGLADIVVAQSEASLVCGCSDPQGPTNGDPSGSDPNGSDPSGNGPSGSDPSGNGPSGSDPTGNGPSGSDPSGNGPSGRDPSGSDPSGNGPSGSDPSDSGAQSPPADKSEQGSGEGSVSYGGIGSKCETNDACAPGYYCAGKRPTIK